MSIEPARKIRMLCNHPWKRELLFSNKSIWHKLWASLDLINDTQEAIDYYLKIPEENFNDGAYLYIYGLLQAMYVQQDAANNLNKALFNEIIDFKNDYPELYDIREQRNNSIGHPTGRGKNDSSSYHIIDGTSIIKSGFNLVSHYPNQNKAFEIKSFDITKSTAIQEQLINEILMKVMGKLNLDFEHHKKNFKGKPLMQLVGRDFNYSISKLYEFDSPLLKANLKHVFETYIEIKNGIEKRYSSLKALPGVQFTSERIDYILQRLQKDLVDSKIEDDIELEVFVDALKNHFEGLLEMVKEIDKEFEE